MKTTQCQTCLSFLTCLMISSALSSDPSASLSDPCDREDVNGCTYLPFTSFPFQKELTPSCNRHDICYGCGQQFGFSREECDNSFLLDMFEACRPFSSPGSQATVKTLSRRLILVNVCKKAKKLLQKQHATDAESVDCANNDLKFLECMETVRNAYALVRAFGGFFLTPSDYCDKDFIPNCLPQEKLR